MTNKPQAKSSLAEKELDRAEKQFQEFDQQIKDLTLDRMNAAPKENVEPQTKLSNKELQESKDVYLKPRRTIGSKEKFNEKFREEYNFAKEYVKFIAENKEIVGDSIEMWTKAFAGVPAEEWVVPTNTPVWGPRYLAEQLTKCKYHRLKMDQSVGTGSDSSGNRYYGAMAVDTTVQRLDAIPVSTRKSIFMGANS